MSIDAQQKKDLNFYAATVRPFRIWDATAKAPVPHRHYKHRSNAQIGALIETKHLSVGSTLEVWDITTGKLVGQYTRRVNGIDIYKEKV